MARQRNKAAPAFHVTVNDRRIPEIPAMSTYAGVTRDVLMAANGAAVAFRAQGIEADVIPMPSSSGGLDYEVHVWYGEEAPLRFSWRSDS